ncbi:MAG TPA: TadE family protein [bacterium]|nr:TadE family protein [bacterium]
MRRNRAPDRSARGQALIELVLALPILLAIASAVIDGGWAVHEAGMVAAAAQAAGRAVAIQEAGTGHCDGAPPASDRATAFAAARAAAPRLNPAAVDVALDYLEPACTGRMRTIVVSVAYPITSLTPWFAPLLNGRRLSAQAAGAIEELPPPWWGQADEVAAQHAQIVTLQAQVASLTSAYQAEAGQVQGQQSEIAALTTADQQAGAQAAYWSQTASYYYSLWQALLQQQQHGGGSGGDRN